MSAAPHPGPSPLASLFRKSSLARNRQRFLGEVVLAGPASTPFAVAASGACLLALLALALVVKVPSRLHAPGVLLPVGGLNTVHAEESGVVEQVLASAGDSVSRGQPLMTLLVDRRLRDGSGSFQTRFESAARQTKMLTQRRERERSAFDAKLRTLLLKRASLESTLASLGESARNSARQAEIAEKDFSRLGLLARNGNIAHRDVEPAEMRLLQARAALNQIESRQSETQAALKRMVHEMATERDSYESLDLGLAMELERLAERAVELDALSRRAVVAPMDGELADVLAGAGDTVSAGTALLRLHQSGSPMEARLYLSSLVAGRAESGQEAVLKLPTFPSRQFGVLRGRIVELTATPVQPGEVSLVPGLIGPAYEARVRLDRQYMQAMGRRWHLRPGLGVEATIVETRRTLVNWLLEPLIRGVGAPGGIPEG